MVIKKKINLNIIFNKCKEIIENKKGILLNKEYKSINTRLKITCLNGHYFTKNKKKLYSGSWCKKCKIYKNENRCKYIFESLFESTFKKCRPNWLVNPKTNRKLELDGYNEELKLAFEYDGEYHYKRSKVNNYTSKRLLDQQYRDNVKDNICKNNNITLIRIPYTIDKKDYQEYIMNLCKKNKIIIKNKEKIDLKKVKLYCTKLEEIQLYAKYNNLNLISKIYNNAKTKLEWKCNNNHLFQITYYNLKKRKNKCMICKKL